MSEAQQQELRRQLNDVFVQVFDNGTVRIHDAMTAKDIEGWDSLTHVNLIVAVEKRFKVSFTTKEVMALRNVGDFLRLIAKKLAG